jgi:hypothetical protein
LSDFRVFFFFFGGGEDGFVFVVARPVLNLILGFLEGEWGVVYVEATCCSLMLRGELHGFLHLINPRV